MKIQIEVTEVASLPETWASASSWPGPGVYRVTSEQEKLNLYSVDEYSVNCLFHGMKHARVVKPDAEPVSELLLLKAIAAASHTSILKGAA